MEKRQQQLAQIQRIVRSLQERLRIERKERATRLRMLDSVSLGLYEEIDKLSKKAPGEQVTDLVLDHVNELIRETRQLIEADPYVQRLTEFVAAGDNPEHRDVVVVLRQIRQGLGRFREELQDLQKREERKLVEARAVEAALDLYFEEGTTPTQRAIKALVEEVPEIWVIGDFGPDREFNFEKLDRTNLAEYFDVPEHGQ